MLAKRPFYEGILKCIGTLYIVTILSESELPRNDLRVEDRMCVIDIVNFSRASGNKMAAWGQRSQKHIKADKIAKNDNILEKMDKLRNNMTLHITVKFRERSAKNKMAAWGYINKNRLAWFDLPKGQIFLEVWINYWTIGDCALLWLNITSRALHTLVLWGQRSRKHLRHL